MVHLQEVTYGSSIAPAAGDILYKGLEVNRSGSLGWIYTNFFTEIPDASIFSLTSDNTTTIEIQWGAGVSNQQLNVRVGETLRISNFSNTFFNGSWKVLAWIRSNCIDL